MALEALNSPATTTTTPPPPPQPPLSTNYNFPTTTNPSEPSHPTEEEYIAFCLLLLSRGSAAATTTTTTVTSPSPPPLVSYKCSICHKEFSSYQALGGHTGTHRKIVSGNHRPPSTSATITTTTTFSSLKNSFRTHECSICNRTFPSGCALGGHKRRHYDGKISGTNNLGFY